LAYNTFEMHIDISVSTYIEKKTNNYNQIMMHPIIVTNFQTCLILVNRQQKIFQNEEGCPIPKVPSYLPIRFEYLNYKTFLN
jgi:hypothetical protein